MKIFISLLVLSVFGVGNIAHANSKRQCLEGNFPSCKTVMNEFGRTSKKDGAVSFFSSACASQNLKVACEVLSVKPDEALKKTLSLAHPSSALFVISGNKLNKIYVIKTIE